MKRLPNLLTGLLPALAAIVCAPANLNAAERPLNVVLLLVDDLGWTDLGCYGSDLYETPNIDRLAAGGVKFDNAYAACTVCSPTRAAVLTGKYPARVHVTDFIPGHGIENTPMRMPEWTKKLVHSEVTLAEALRPAGYKTAHVGKWHLAPRDGEPHPEYWPETQGFDVNIGGYRGGAPGSYFWPYGRGKDGAANRVKNIPSGGGPGEYLTDRLTDEALKRVEQWKDEPFFLYFPFYNLGDDPHEDRNLAKANAKKAAELRRLLRDWRDEVGAQMAVPNPDYDPEKPTGWKRGKRFRQPEPYRRF